MDRSAWALSLIAAMVSWYLPAPCAAQSAPARAANETPPPELLPPLEALKDPFEKRARSGPSVPAAMSRQQQPATSETEDPAPQIPTTAAIASELQTEGWQLLKESLSPVPSWNVPIESRAKPSARPWPLPEPGSARGLTRLWSAVGSTYPPMDPAVRRSARTQPATPALPQTPDALAVRLKKAPLESTDVGLPINLATALRLSDARPLIVAAAQASVWIAEAQLTRAKVLWVPTFMFGFDYVRHDGGGPDINKGVNAPASVNFYYGGAGFIQNVNLSDVFFQPLVARQTLNSRQFDIQTAKNDALMQTADAYFQVHQQRGTYAGFLYAVERGHDLIQRIEQLSADLVPKVEVDRARNFVADLEQSATSAREAWRVQSANLTEVLRLDPRTIVVPLEHDHLQITLVDPDQSLNDLMRIAINNRPEIASQRAQVLAAEAIVRREKMRPILPAVMLNGFQSAMMDLQFGIFGLGPNSSLNQWFGRDDVSLQLMWQFDAMGIGNLARIKSQRGAESRAIVDFYKTQDRVAAEVTRALARLQSATARVQQAERSLRTAIVTFNGNFEGLKQTVRFEDVLVLVYRPQEAVYALDLMRLSLFEYFGTVAEYNRAQFELYHALGYPAAEIALRHSPGEIVPANTSRPEFLPPVGNGPPPATR
jgi:outer membrane protein TolC